MDALDTITVTTNVQRQVRAARADLFVTIRGQSFFSGQAALRKAREVRDVVEALARSGLTEERIEVVAVQAEVTSGALSSSSSASYHLRLRLPDLDRFAEMVGAVVGRKNAHLSRVEWQYDDLEAMHDTLLTEALQRVRARAELIARELGHELIALHRLSERFDEGSDAPAYPPQGEMFAARRRAAMDEDLMTGSDLGLAVGHSKIVAVAVQAEYRVRSAGGADRD
jgi:uncharacterized protein YggE